MRLFHTYSIIYLVVNFYMERIKKTLKMNEEHKKKRVKFTWDCLFHKCDGKKSFSATKNTSKDLANSGYIVTIFIKSIKSYP